jgi:hypothetical protein
MFGCSACLIPSKPDGLADTEFNSEGRNDAMLTQEQVNEIVAIQMDYYRSENPDNEADEEINSCFRFVGEWHPETTFGQFNVALKAFVKLERQRGTALMMEADALEKEEQP